MTYRFGIIGAGMIAPLHHAAIEAIPSAQTTGIMDNGNGQGAAIAPGLDHTGADDIAQFLARDDIDIVTIASPSGAHGEAAIAAARAGKHCVIEKPMEITVARIDAIIAAHEAAGTYVGGIFNSRYSEAAQILKKAVRAGRFGEITFASALGPWWRDQAYYDDSEWKGTWALDGGGAVMNQGIHSVDLLQWIVGSPVVEVSARIATLAHERIEVEDTAAATLQFESGALGTIACTTSLWPGHFRSITIGGTRGTAVLTDETFLVWQFADTLAGDDDIRARLVGHPGAGIGAADPSAGVTAAGHQAVFEAFIRALEAGETPEIDGNESRKAVSIIEAIYASARNGGAPVTPP